MGSMVDPSGPKPNSFLTVNFSSFEQLFTTALIAFAPKPHDSHDSFSIPSWVTSRHARSLRRVRLRHRSEMSSSASSLMLVYFRSPPRSSRACCTDSSRASTSAEEEKSSSSSAGRSTLRVKEPPKYPRWDYCKWRDKEAEILRDVEPTVLLAKEILHSVRYMDGETLSAEDEKVVVERLLAYHPHSKDKISCGISSIMVDRHPQFKRTRCLFVIRTNGVWIDFSYQKCLRAYIRQKYPAHAERFIREHFKRGSS